MAVTSPNVSVTTTATALNTAGDSDGVVGAAYDFYNDGAVTVYVGGPTVTSSGATKGRPVAPGSSLSVQVTSGSEAYYGITASGTSTVIVLSAGL